jgi:hypothetical protein
LTFLRARYYDPSVGRFLTRDTYPAYAPVPQTLHRYVYVENNPVNHTDPTGQYCIDDEGGKACYAERKVQRPAARSSLIRVDSCYLVDDAFIRGIQNAINTAAIIASVPPKMNGADGPKPGHAPTPCHNTPAMTDAGKASKPMMAL